MSKKVMLLIMDGFGLAGDSEKNAISRANTTNLDYIFSQYPNAALLCCGSAVGLPDGQMGNSEVGHTNIGAGRVVWQDMSKISKELLDGQFYNNKVLCDAVNHAKKNKSALHLIGLLSDGGVHSLNTHLYALLRLCKEQNFDNVYIHAILDGRDVPPRSADKYINELEAEIKKIGLGKLVSISGRFYAMDRDKRWDRISKYYDMLTLKEGRQGFDALSLLELARENDENDEFVLPSCTNEMKVISDNDAIIFFNYRPDRAREITRVFTEKEFDSFERKVRLNNLHYVCFTEYDESLKNVEIAFKKDEPKNVLGEYISKLGLKQLRIAETEKYAHVTFFFNGGIEKSFKGEDRILIPSPKVLTYDLKPEMSAYEVTEKVIEAIGSNIYDLIILNLANCDMVGHTGIMDAAIRAVEAVDDCVGKIFNATKENDYDLIITADHGNADEMLDDAGNVVTSHSLNPVPIAIAGSYKGKIKDGALCDIAPTILKLMGLEIPKEMTGKSLIE